MKAVRLFAHLPGPGRPDAVASWLECNRATEDSMACHVFLSAGPYTLHSAAQSDLRREYAVAQAANAQVLSTLKSLDFAPAGFNVSQQVRRVPQR